MIHTFSLGRAARYYPERTALASAGTRSTFQELNDRVARIAASLSRHGFKVGDRLAFSSRMNPSTSNWCMRVPGWA
jgi:non-ribosomal peptide synthetase component E (peptide arylation enzyme)